MKITLYNATKTMYLCLFLVGLTAVIVQYVLGGRAGDISHRRVPELKKSAFERHTDISLYRSQLPIVVICKKRPEFAERVAAELSAHSLRVVPQSKVDKWLEDHPTWATPEEIAVGTSACYALQINIDRTGPFACRVHMIEVHSLECGERLFSKTTTCPTSIARLFYSHPEKANQ